MSFLHLSTHHWIAIAFGAGAVIVAAVFITTHLLLESGALRVRRERKRAAEVDAKRDRDVAARHNRSELEPQLRETA